MTTYQGFISEGINKDIKCPICGDDNMYNCAVFNGCGFWFQDSCLNEDCKFTRTSEPLNEAHLSGS